MRGDDVAEIAARAVALLGERSGPAIVVCPAAPRVAAALLERGMRAARDGETADAAVIVLLGTPAIPADRQRLLHAAVRTLPAGAPVVLVDHSQPRTAWLRLGALPRLLARGLRPSRARYPSARELQALGLTVERLELAAAEAIQIIRARR